MPERREIRKNTKLLQSSTEPLWVRIRELLVEKGLKPKTTFLAYSYPEDLNYEYGIVVSAEGKVYEYGFDYLRKNISQGIFSEWTDITDNQENCPHSLVIKKALLVSQEPNDSTD